VAGYDCSPHRIAAPETSIMIRIVLTLAFVLATLAPTMSIAGERSLSLTGRIEALASGPRQKIPITPRPVRHTPGGEQCPRDACMHHGCRCDHPDTCGSGECCSGNYQCDRNNYCQCVGD
jgi:hypothetical protein